MVRTMGITRLILVLAMAAPVVTTAAIWGDVQLTRDFLNPPLKVTERYLQDSIKDRNRLCGANPEACLDLSQLQSVLCTGSDNAAWSKSEILWSSIFSNIKSESQARLVFQQVSLCSKASSGQWVASLQLLAAIEQSAWAKLNDEVLSWMEKNWRNGPADNRARALKMFAAQLKVWEKWNPFPKSLLSRLTKLSLGWVRPNEMANLDRETMWAWSTALIDILPKVGLQRELLKQFSKIDTFELTKENLRWAMDLNWTLCSIQPSGHLSTEDCKKIFQKIKVEAEFEPDQSNLVDLILFELNIRSKTEVPESEIQKLLEKTGKWNPNYSASLQESVKRYRAIKKGPPLPGDPLTTKPIRQER